MKVFEEMLFGLDPVSDWHPDDCNDVWPYWCGGGSSILTDMN